MKTPDKNVQLVIVFLIILLTLTLDVIAASSTNWYVNENMNYGLFDSEIAPIPSALLYVISMLLTMVAVILVAVSLKRQTYDTFEIPIAWIFNSLSAFLSIISCIVHLRNKDTTFDFGFAYGIAWVSVIFAITSAVACFFVWFKHNSTNDTECHTKIYKDLKSGQTNILLRNNFKSANNV